MQKNEKSFSALFSFLLSYIFLCIFATISYKNKNKSNYVKVKKARNPNISRITFVFASHNYYHY